ncbi:MAG: hypothetical protein CM1200mP30_20790 [Pseudomonadota bacterium]|nr:MAG: hypothetical protein CM1200mP30_20790 [Pseudomonadota bacterium]
MYSDIVKNKVDKNTIKSVKRHGSVVIKNVFPREKSEEWFNQLKHYLDQNGYYEQDDPGLDNYFSKPFKTDRPQICASTGQNPKFRQDKVLKCLRQDLPESKLELQEKQ